MLPRLITVPVRSGSDRDFVFVTGGCAVWPFARGTAE